MVRILMALAAATSLAAGAPAGPEVRVTKVRRVFHNGEHNAFTDLCRFRGRYYLTFRSCPDGHAVHPTSSIIVLASEDAMRWEQVHRFRVEKRDVRDPHLLVFRDRLFVYTGTWYCGESSPREYEMNRHLGYAAWSEDGRAWQGPVMLEGTYGHYIWRAASFGGKAYLCGRRMHEFAEAPRSKRELIESAMLESDDGLIWRTRSLFQETWGDETAMLFEPDGRVLAVARRGTRAAQLCRSAPPYSTWERVDLDRYIGGPLLARWGERYVVGGRKMPGGRDPKTSLCWLIGDGLHEFAELPSGGDNSYPGFVALDPARALVSWYSSHERDESGKTITAIYMADLEIVSATTLWDEAVPMPKASEIPLLRDVEFRVVKRREPEVDAEAEAEMKGCHWLHGAAIAWHEGALYASFGHNRGAENTATEEARGRKSTDGGKTWGPVFLIDAGDEPDLAVSHGVLLSRAGALWAFHGAFYNRMERVHTRAYVLDEATGRWDPRGVVARDGFWPMQEPRKLDDGNWIMAGISVSEGYGGTDDPAAVAISRGDDLTRWDVIRVPKPESMAMWGESAVLVDGPSLSLIARFGEKALALTSVSRDRGRTWSEIRESNLPMSPVKPYAGTLSTGEHYLIATMAADCGNRRSPLTIALTRPGDRRFSRIFRIRDAICDGPGESHARAALAYPYAVEHDGALYVIYSNDGGRGKNLNSAEMAVIPIERLSSPAGFSSTGETTFLYFFGVSLRQRTEGWYRPQQSMIRPERTHGSGDGE
ncbi:MAG: exo-alpha-sialidase [Planctomycetes bacterium]|nr:exo-alpha-sialidase [Planctomycetota bacterium]